LIQDVGATAELDVEALRVGFDASFTTRHEGFAEAVVGRADATGS
jgi:hypothetical protein